jgi:hypothetical protein
MKINHLLAAPSFKSWMTGDSLDLGQILHTENGKPRIAIFSIAHLSESERMFFVSLLLNQTMSWMRSRPGTTSLRALLYMDEIFGFMPPVAEPPSKKPLLTLLKQARAYGLGVVLATQNPADLDYKGLSNTGTWFIGRLQTERDKKRVLDGLDGVSMGDKKLDKKHLSQVLSQLGKRVFLLHNVHEDRPEIFHTRWVMSYLRGPLTRGQISSLTTPPAVQPSDQTGSTAPMASTAERKIPSGTKTPSAPLLDPAIPQVFAPVREFGTGQIQYVAAILGLGRVQFIDRKTRKPLFKEEVALLASSGTHSASGASLDWQAANQLDLSEVDLAKEPMEDGLWGEVPGAAGKAKSYSKWRTGLSNHLYRSRSLDLYKSTSTGTVSLPGESERDFRLRLRDVAHELRDLQTEELRRSYAVKVDRLEERLRKAKQALEKEREQASGQKLQAAISAGAALLSVFSGRKKLSYTTLSRAKTALRGMGSSARDAGDVKRATETIESLTEQLESLNRELESEIESLAAAFDTETEELEVSSIRPRRTDVEVRLVALAWMPYAADAQGNLKQLWR